MSRPQTVRFLVTVTLEHHEGKIAAKGDLTGLVKDGIAEVIEEGCHWHAGEDGESIYTMVESKVDLVDAAHARWLDGNAPKVAQAPRVRSEPEPAEDGRAAAPLVSALPVGTWRHDR